MSNKSYLVQKDDTWGSVSKKFYGDEKVAKALAGVNKISISSPSDLISAAELKIPDHLYVMQDNPKNGLVKLDIFKLKGKMSIASDYDREHLHWGKQYYFNGTENPLPALSRDEYNNCGILLEMPSTETEIRKKALADIKDDVDLVARVIFAEICNDIPYRENAIGVAQVIMNRINHNWNGKNEKQLTARIIVEEKGHFSCAWDPNKYLWDPSLAAKTPELFPPVWTLCCFLAAQLCAKASIPENILGDMRQFFFDIQYGLPFCEGTINKDGKLVGKITHCTHQDLEKAKVYLTCSKSKDEADRILRNLPKELSKGDAHNLGLDPHRIRASSNCLRVKVKDKDNSPVIFFNCEWDLPWVD
jgi:hypothetical protein